MAIKITASGRVSRIYTEERNGYAKTYIVLDADGGGKYVNKLRFTVKRGEDAPCAEGDEVTVEAFVDGREWVSGDGRVLYFTDFNVAKVTGGSAAAEPKIQTSAVLNATKAQAIEAWQKRHPDSEDWGEFAKVCKETCPAVADAAGKAGKKFSELAKPADWAAVVNAINGITVAQAAAEITAQDEDDLPF